jgi:CDP-glucose 4,6-dehydratase
MVSLQEFYSGMRVLVTGHTGFKGSWLCAWLKTLGAEVIGYSLEPNTQPNAFTQCAVAQGMRSVIGDVRDRDGLMAVFAQAQPQIVFHLAAQPIVRESYARPADTFEINIMGTVNVLECVRLTPGVRSVVNVTTDKVYRNREWIWGYRENEELDGYDPYSNSKSCSDLVTACYRRSFFAEGAAVSTARAGNVIGGGDFAADRIVPDCVRATMAGQPIFLRNPGSVRPYQHVLEPLGAYLMIAKAQYEDREFCGAYNVGPPQEGCVTTEELVRYFCHAWGDGASYTSGQSSGPHEAGLLKLDASLITSRLGWRPCWNVERSVERAVQWYHCFADGGDTAACMQAQILEYMKETGSNK